MDKFTKKLTSKDVALGIGRKATEDELREYLNRPRKEEFKSIDQVKEELLSHLNKRNQNRKAS
jgi:hypothetical protein